VTQPGRGFLTIVKGPLTRQGDTSLKETHLKLQHENRFAFKEWAAVCTALAAGKQSLIVRKGGIHEGRDGFRVEHGEFWLYPTQFHQKPAATGRAAHSGSRSR
jgi:hypothetical protein